MTRTASVRVLITAALFVRITSTAVSAQQPLAFERGPDLAITDAPRAIAAADVTGDGWIDLILAGTGRGSITVIPNHGVEDGDNGQRFRIPQDYVVGGGPFDIAIGDLNRDGRLDIAVANADAESVTLLFNTGAGNFGAPVSLPVTGNPRGIAVGDFNRDGVLDIAVTRFATAQLDVIFGAGDGTFPTRRTHGAPVNPQGMAVGDFNRDGWQDVIVAAASGVVRIYEMFATGAVIRDLPAAGHGWNVIAPGDLDRDGRLDVAVASTGSSLVYFLYNRASGWTASEAIPVAASPRGLAIGDLNQNGTSEVIVAGRAASMFTVISRAASGAVSTAEFASGTGARAVALADFDKTGRVGVATANEYGRSATVSTNRTNFGPAPAFAFEPTEPRQSFWDVSGLADFNENGTPDYVGDNRVMLDGTTVVKVDGSYPWASGGLAIDANQDGHQDVIVHVPGGIQTHFGDGRGGFTRGPVTLAAAGGHPTDINRDGKIDLVTATNNGSTGAIEVYLGRGDGTFARSATTTPVTRTSALVALVDLNRDARQDALLNDETGVFVMLGDGSGGFGEATRFQPGVQRSHAAVGEFTGDGILDLVTSDKHQFSWGLSIGPYISIARGVGDGTFEFLRQYDVSDEGLFEWATRVTLADLDADGALDIFTDKGHVLKGSNTGDFQPPARFAVFGSRLLADINDDSLLDLVGVSSPGVTGNVFLNTRRAPSENRPPTGFWGFPDEMNWGYATWWYAEDETGFFPGYITDPDLHAIRYVWRIEGRVSGRYEFWGPDAGTPPGRYAASLTMDDYRGGSLSDSFTVVVTPFKETVLLPADDAQLYGAWHVVNDSGASSHGRTVRHADAGAPKLQTALASPTDYFEMGFIADPTQEYKLWLRLKADNNSWANDSVFVQFTGAKDASGNPIYEIGSASAMAVNLEECSGCGVSGWGWEDDGWGAPNVNGVTLRFPEGGPQTIRIQTREDGVSVDAVVLSAEKYRTARPGSAKDDTTILQHQGPWMPPYYPRR
jgi:hypothetical protein